MRIKRFDESSKSEYVETVEDAFTQMMDEYTDCEFILNPFGGKGNISMTVSREIYKIDFPGLLSGKEELHDYVEIIDNYSKFMRDIQDACSVVMEHNLFDGFQMSHTDPNNLVIVFYNKN